MPWEPRPIRTEEDRIDLDARLMQLHDPDEIRARYWHENMKIRRVFLSLLWIFAATAVYFFGAFISQSTNWPALVKFCRGLVWLSAHVLTVMGGVWLVMFLFLFRGRRLFKELDT